MGPQFIMQAFGGGSCTPYNVLAKNAYSVGHRSTRSWGGGNGDDEESDRGEAYLPLMLAEGRQDKSGLGLRYMALRDPIACPRIMVGARGATVAQIAMQLPMPTLHAKTAGGPPIMVTPMTKAAPDGFHSGDCWRRSAMAPRVVKELRVRGCSLLQWSTSQSS
ncbi:hypothetical protein FIBSPDRAFT_1052479 [Athelia psychrophila]|uniref:Uncharacterized protein n=1 Tax=Athelia psychrophila TaxID=1759441 RepID=A0A165X8T6_9AGAM|nr:hypothetical protein FIBSPDRAFT_1052479 [Fibularhizoctonia sp. CBS 109695]